VPAAERIQVVKVRPRLRRRFPVDRGFSDDANSVHLKAQDLIGAARDRKDRIGIGCDGMDVEPSLKTVGGFDREGIAIEGYEVGMASEVGGGRGLDDGKEVSIIVGEARDADGLGQVLPGEKGSEFSQMVINEPEERSFGPLGAAETHENRHGAVDN
jgi:hypothetical protein